MAKGAGTILFVDDDPRQREVAAAFLEGHGFRVDTAADAESALARLHRDPLPDMVLMDVRMPGMGGIEGLCRMHELRPALPVILLTAYADVRDAVEAMRAGALDYLEKPVDLQELATIVGETLGVAAAPPQAGLPPLPEGFVVASPAMEAVIREADSVASTDATVLIEGESGTGKEKVAEFIHARSRRSAGPLVAVNCAAITHSLFESELFGHVKGAFTGADTARAGRFQIAGGGTLLLDEVGELPLDIQPKLLRVLEDGTYQQVGESVTRHADARIVACTNRDLEAAVASGTFREDLFWRLNVFALRIPPLRDRTEEIEPLCRVFLARARKERLRLSPSALELLKTYPWPGNVRELANVTTRAAILATGPVILPDHLPATIRQGARAAPQGAAGAAGGGQPAVTSVEEAERRAIREALRATGGNRTETARLLGMSRRTLFYRLKKYAGSP